MNLLSGGSPLGALFGDYGLFSNPTGAWDKFKNGNTNEVQQEIAEQNLKFQKENLDYQKALQQKIFEREDSSYQRTVNDMRQAGLSPLMMNGTNGAGEAIATSPLHNDYHHTDIGNLQAVSDILSTVQSLKFNQTQIEKQQIENYINSETAGSQISFKNGLAVLQSYDQLDAQMKADFNNFYGIHSGMSEKERLGMILRKSLVGSMDKYGQGESSVLLSDGFRPFDNSFDYSSNLNLEKSISQLVDSYLKDKSGKSGKSGFNPDWKDTLLKGIMNIPDVFRGNW